jgi:triosephosphate isomerase (TIM)
MNTEKPIVIANWKMNPQKEEEAVKLAKLSDKREVVICPPFIFLNSVRKEIKKAKLGAQNCFFEKQGAFTGEISSKMLKSYSCEYVIVGHSERREYFFEKEEDIKRKIEVLLEEKITPIFCIGEDEKNSDSLKDQLKVLEDISLKKVIIAYEPKFAIGTGIPYNVEEAEKKKVLIKSILAKIKGKEEEAIIFYGGSVDSKNALDYIKKAGFDGILVGTASIKEKEFEKMLKNLSL